jgi:ankyrin repeat domain-containing protein 50
MVEAVSHCISFGHVMKQLETLPASLDVLYEASFARIERQTKDRAALAKRVLLWIIFAIPPFTVEDVQYAAGRDPSFDWGKQEDLVPESLLVSVCCGLVTIERNTYISGFRLVRELPPLAFSISCSLFSKTTPRSTR